MRATPTTEEGAEALPFDVTPPSIRRCRRCRKMQPTAMFYKIRNRHTVRHCRECQRVENNKNARLIERRAILNEVKSVGCIDCGFIAVDRPEVFDLDHRPGEVKLAGVAALVTKGSHEDFLAEIAKCDVVCANCHRTRTKHRKQYGFGADWKSLG